MNLITDKISFNFKFVLSLFLITTIIYSFIFYMMDYYILSIIAFAGLFVYIICIKAIDTNDYDMVFLLSHLHIVISAACATMILGWDYGFYLVIIAISSTTYLNIFKNRLITYILTGFEFVIFIIVYMVSNIYFPKVAGDFAELFYLINLAFLLFLFVTICKIYNIIN